MTAFEAQTRAPFIGLGGRDIRTISADDLRPIPRLHPGFLARHVGRRRASLKFTNLSGYDLTGCGLAEADLSGALLQRVKLAGADRREVNLFGADLSRSDLTETCLESADCGARHCETPPWFAATCPASICARAC